MGKIDDFLLLDQKNIKFVYKNVNHLLDTLSYCVCLRSRSSNAMFKSKSSEYVFECLIPLSPRFMLLIIPIY